MDQPKTKLGIASSKHHGTATALTHHALAGKALAKGDTKLAMHHIGHVMKALRPSGSILPPAAGSKVGAVPMVDLDADMANEPDMDVDDVTGQPAKMPGSKPAMGGKSAMFAKLKSVKPPVKSGGMYG